MPNKENQINGSRFWKEVKGAFLLGLINGRGKGRKGKSRKEGRRRKRGKEGRQREGGASLYSDMVRTGSGEGTGS